MSLPALAAALVVAAAGARADTNWTVVGWNDFGIQWMEGRDYSVFALFPPANNIRAHVMRAGHRVDGAAKITVTYEAVADASGSINRTSASKINFWQYSSNLYGVAPVPDQGLFGFAMPGVSNTPQAMAFEAGPGWYKADGIPITPDDDAGAKNYYPLFRLRAYSNGTEMAHTDIVLPVSDEATCANCHQSGSGDAAKPSAGWVWDADPDRACKLNILRLHDDYNLGGPTYDEALSNAGYRADGLYPTVRMDGKPILCAACHQSNFMPATTNLYPGIRTLTRAMHHAHAIVNDPATDIALDDTTDRSACYQCHPGPTTHAVRGVMGSSVAPDGTLAIACQSCHGSMSDVGSASRRSYLDLPSCQSCHTGPATHNNGELRYTSTFDSNGLVRVAVDTLFATNPDTPVTNTSLFHLSTGHGALHCEACHGSTHAEGPSSQRNDNVQNIAEQGYAGELAECGACHNPVPTAATGGPHGMHPIGATWVKSVSATDHRGAAQANTSACQVCHGLDYKGTVLSRVLGNRSVNTSNFGTKNWWRGTQIGCYTCHNGPSDNSTISDHAPSATTRIVATVANTPTNLTLSATDTDVADVLTYRIVYQPQHGTVALTNNIATYLPAPDFAGVDAFAYAAWDGKLDSNLASGIVQVAEATCVLDAKIYAGDSVPMNVPVPFWGNAVLHGCLSAPTWAWTFGDGSPAVTNPVTSHIYLAPGDYPWQAVLSWGRNHQAITGLVTITTGIIDEDGDGIGDEWELQNFGRLGAVSNDSDVDGDHFRDGAEYLAGTDPTNGASYLGIKALNVQTNGQTVITWQSVARRFYALDAGTSADTTVFLPVETNVPATPPVNVYTNPPDPAHPFYRVRLE